MGATRPHNPAARGELLGATAPWQNRSQTKKNKPTLNTKLRILPNRPSARSPFSAPKACAISASKNSWLTAFTMGRRNSPSPAIIAFPLPISFAVLLLSFRVMVQYSVGCFTLQLLTMTSLFAEPSGHYHTSRTHFAFRADEVLVVPACDRLLSPPHRTEGSVSRQSRRRSKVSVGVGSIARRPGSRPLGGHHGLPPLGYSRSNS